jgi:signal transduction histidine kinase
MTQRSEGALTLACVADQSSTAAALNEALATLFPAATILSVDTDAERVVPDGVDCVVVDATVNGTDGVDVLRGLRARGYARAAVLVVDPARAPAIADDAGIARSGARCCSLQGDTLAPLAVAVSDAILVQDDIQGGTAAGQAAVKALRQTQRLIAAGELAMRLQHSLNNPLAALLAEAQLLELEALPPDHRESVQRIIELCRRVVDVVRGLDGVGRA